PPPSTSWLDNCVFTGRGRQRKGGVFPGQRAGARGSGPASPAGMYEQLRAEWNRKNLSLSKCGDLLGRLKVRGRGTAGREGTRNRDILEIGAQWSILKKDIPSFERYMAQLKCYYFDYKDELPESAYKHQLLGLNLLFLLSQNRVAEFHTELERLPAKDIQTNVYIKHPVSLEQVTAPFSLTFLNGGLLTVCLTVSQTFRLNLAFFCPLMARIIRVGRDLVGHL
uniref:CSN8/PSMD8/EIF3K domain-containing protein n=1 Tax=Laticauda laticaudata TaxID=8630 RepID=A0A8C5WW75_LATLA